MTISVFGEKLWMDIGDAYMQTPCGPIHLLYQTVVKAKLFHG
jgi:hypothetical protein